MTYDYRTALELIPTFTQVEFQYEGKTRKGRLMSYDKDKKHCMVFVSKSFGTIRVPVSDIKSAD